MIVFCFLPPISRDIKVRKLVCFCAGLIVAAVLQGCGASTPSTYPVTGTITFKGTPIEKGSIVFDPVDGKGMAGMATIANGQISGQVPAGEKILRISATTTSDKKDEYGEPITESLIPDKYGSASQIKKTVVSDGENKFDLLLD